MERVRRYQLSVLFALLLGYFSCGLALQRGVAVPAFLYWALFLAIPCISILYISHKESSNVFVLLVVSITVFSMFFLQNHTWYPCEVDTLFEMQVTSIIFKTGEWHPGMGTAMAYGHSFYPLMHILVAFLSLVTGINLYEAMFIIPWLKAVGFILFFYLFARDRLSDVNRLFHASTVFFASIIYLGCVWYLGYPHRETFAEILFMGALWIYAMKNVGFGMRVALMLLTFSLAISHHFTSYLFILLIMALYLFGKRRKMFNPLLIAMPIFFWTMFVSWELSSRWIISFFRALEMVITLRFGGLEVPFGAAISYYYTPFENFLLLMNPVLVGAFALPSFLKEMRSRKKAVFSSVFTVTTFVFIGLLILSVFFLLFRTGMGTSAYRIWGFAYIPLSIWVTVSLFEKFMNIRLRTIVSLALVAILFASMNLSVIHGIKKWYVPRGYMETYMFSDSMVNTAHWCNATLDGTIIGDNLAYGAVGSWGYKWVDHVTFRDWYRTKDNKHLESFDYIILSPWDTITYSDTFRTPIDPFKLLPNGLSLIYSSGDLVVYCNSSRI